MLPSIWYETWLDTPAERGLRVTRSQVAAELPGGSARRRIGHVLINVGQVLAGERQSRQGVHAAR